MATLKCPTCGVENLEEGKYCAQCGGSLDGDEPEKDKAGDRFKTIVAVLIAIVSVAGAVLAWRISVAASSAADADVSGIVSTISRNRALVASKTDMYQNLWTYLQVRIHDLLSDSMTAEREQYPSDDPIRDQLWSQSWTEILVAEEYLDQVDIRPEYIRPDGSYDGQAAQDIDMAHRSLGADFDPQGRHFAEADHQRFKVQWLMGLALVLSVTLLLYTMAEVIRHPLKYACFALGTGTFILVLVALPLIELTLG